MRYNYLDYLCYIIIFYQFELNSFFQVIFNDRCYAEVNNSENEMLSIFVSTVINLKTFQGLCCKTYFLESRLYSEIKEIG